MRSLSRERISIYLGIFNPKALNNVVLARVTNQQKATIFEKIKNVLRKYSCSKKKFESLYSKIKFKITDDALTSLVKNNKLLMLKEITLYEKFGVTNFYLISNSLRNIRLMLKFRKTNNKPISKIELIDSSDRAALISAVQL